MGGLSAVDFVFPHASDDAVGEVSFVGSSCFSPGLAFAEFAFDERAGVVDVAVLHDAGNEQHAVNPSVPAKVETVTDRQTGAFARRHCDEPLRTLASPRPQAESRPHRAARRHAAAQQATTSSGASS
jgi:hypothetical protein